MTAVPQGERDLFARLPQLVSPQSAWSKWLTRAICLGLLVLVAVQIGRTSPADLREALPDSPLFWPALVALYLTLPAADWIIFRRLWRLPLAGFPVLVGKRISNELLLMYSGEVYFYLWARRRAGLTAAPFGAIKDVNILSALAGNGLSLILLIAAAPFLGSLDVGDFAGALVGSAVLMLAVPTTILVLSRRLFTLTGPQLVWVFAVHVARLVTGVLLTALLWRLALPEAPLSLWVALSALRLFLARLPLANVELLFAAVAGVLVGDARDVAAVVSMTSMSMLLLHLLVGGGLSLWAFVAGGRGPVWGGADPPDREGP